MSIEQIVTEAAALPEQERKDLIGRLLAIGRDRREEEEEARKQMAELIDDNDPSHWCSGEELRRMIEADEASK